MGLVHLYLLPQVLHAHDRFHDAAQRHKEVVPGRRSARGPRRLGTTGGAALLLVRVLPNGDAPRRAHHHGRTISVAASMLPGRERLRMGRPGPCAIQLFPLASGGRGLGIPWRPSQRRLLTRFLRPDEDVGLAWDLSRPVLGGYRHAPQHRPTHRSRSALAWLALHGRNARPAPPCLAPPMWARCRLARHLCRKI